MSSFRGAKNAGWYGSNLSQPIAINCNFVVDSTNGNGLGIRSLKSNGWVRNVFMNTSASLTGTVTNTSFNITAISGGTSSLVVGMPVQGTGIPAGTVITSILSSSSVSMSNAATGTHASESITYQGYNNGSANPNPASGLILVQFKQNFNIYLGGFNGFVSPVTGSNVNISSGLTAGNAYVITAVGTSTAANWQAVGLPLGLVPTVGQSFVATTSSAGTGTGTVKAVGVSGCSSIEVIGDANQSIANSNIAQYGGAYVLAQTLGPTLTMNSYTPAGTNSSATPPIFTGTPAVLTGSVTYGLVAPANNSVIGMTFFFDQSSADPIMQNGDPSSS